MQKVANFTQFEQKNTHTSLCIIVHLCTIATVTVHICMVTVACVFIILLISVSRFFLSLLRAQRTQCLLFFFFLRCTQTHPHPRRQINTQTHPHTNKLTQTNQQRDRSVLDWNDRCLWVRAVILERCVEKCEA